MIKIGLTGGIGAGKSYVASRLTSLFSIPVYNCDEESKHIVANDPSIREQLTKKVSPDVYTSEGNLNKQVLADFIFSDKANREVVNSIVHPAVIRHFESWTQTQHSSFVGVESAILFESGLSLHVDRIVCVIAPLEVRISRAMLRDSSTRRQTEARINSQMSNEELARRSHYSIVNDGQTDVDTQLRNLVRLLSE